MIGAGAGASTTATSNDNDSPTVEQLLTELIHVPSSHLMTIHPTRVRSRARRRRTRALTKEYNDDDLDDDLLHDDIIYLNIKENMNDGKSQTWLKYVTLLKEEYNYSSSRLLLDSFDLISKTDSDTVVLPNKLLHYLDENLNSNVNKKARTILSSTSSALSYKRLIYGGIPYNQVLCGGVNLPHCARMKPQDVYMSGEFYFLSYELVKHMFNYYNGSSDRPIPYSIIDTGGGTTTINTVEKHEDLIIGTMVMESTTKSRDADDYYHDNKSGRDQEEEQQLSQEHKQSSRLKLMNIRRMDSLWIHDYELTKSIEGFRQQYIKHI